ncbi:hypothetical protein [Raineya orbicola]|jgi:uncharacterized protein YneF (UPF0154 family)|uniref:Uncharacterized protein n=1 Tax=Raineya orbicola TaxID=2016530 RepID=A0A2N3IJC5_9BACT|nr:hypothetical protein [Raineya orbicola]PKQ70333.1 hypothetical protein Rain11_0712 [Raineya orbicola]
MKKIVFTFICLIILSCESVIGQRPSITRDQMLHYFKNNPPFEAEEKIKKLEYENFNYKSVYDDKELKSYVLKLVDRREYFEHEVRKDMQRYLEIIADTNRLKDDIWSFLYKRKRSDKVVDSLVQIPSIITQYRDSVIQETEKRYRRRPNKLSIPDDTRFVEMFKYREVYDSIKLWSKLDSREKYFITLFDYNDPEIIKKTKDLVKRLLKNRINQKEINLLLLIFTRKTSFSFIDNQ